MWDVWRSTTTTRGELCVHVLLMTKTHKSPAICWDFGMILLHLLSKIFPTFVNLLTQWCVMMRWCVFRRSGTYLRLRQYRGGGTGPIWLDEVYCTGNESSLVECGHNGWGVLAALCSHDIDVWISCDYGQCTHDTLISYFSKKSR